MKTYKKIFSILLILFILIYFIPLIVEGLKPETSKIRKNFPDIKTVTVLNKTMAYKEFGEGFPVVMIHGYTYSTIAWEKNISAITKAGFKVYAVDLFGHGMSDKPLDMEYSYTKFAEQIFQFIVKLKLKKVHLIGHSMGGGTSIKLICMHPEVVQKAALIGSGGLPHKTNSNMLFALMRYPLLGELMFAFNLKFVVKLSLSKITFNDKFKISDKYIDSYCLPMDTRGYGNMYLYILRNKFKDLTDCMKTINNDVLIIFGEKDRMIEIETGRRMHSLIKGSNYLEIKDGPHSVMETDPEIVNRAIVEFLKK